MAATATAYAPNRYHRVHLHPLSLIYAPTKGWVCSSLKGYSLNCITFRTATDPAAVCGLLNPYSDKILCVRGNCDSEVDSMVLDFNTRSDCALLLIDGRTVFATHGHIYNKQNLPQCDVFLQGHTHVSAFERREGYVFINPGSVSIPIEGTSHSCIVWDGAAVRHIDLETKETYMENII